MANEWGYGENNGKCKKHFLDLRKSDNIDVEFRFRDCFSFLNSNFSAKI